MTNRKLSLVRCFIPIFPAVLIILEDTEQDIDNLIEKTEKEGDVVEESSNNAMAFAKIWSLHKEDVEELPDDKNDQDDAWAQTLAKMVDDQKQAEKEEKTGRGARRKAALTKVSNSQAPLKGGKVLINVLLCRRAILRAETRAQIRRAVIINGNQCHCTPRKTIITTRPRASLQTAITTARQQKVLPNSKKTLILSLAT